MPRSKEEIEKDIAKVTADIGEIRAEEKRLVEHLQPKKQELRWQREKLRREIAALDPKGWAVVIGWFNDQIEISAVSVTQEVRLIGADLKVAEDGKLRVIVEPYRGPEISSEINVGESRGFPFDTSDKKPSNDISVNFFKTEEEARTLYASWREAGYHPFPRGST